MPNSNYPPPYLTGPPGNQSISHPTGIKDSVPPINAPSTNVQRGVITQPTPVMPSACPQPVSFTNQATPNANSSSNEKYRKVRILIRTLQFPCFTVWVFDIEGDCPRQTPILEINTKVCRG